MPVLRNPFRKSLHLPNGLSDAQIAQAKIYDKKSPTATLSTNFNEEPDTIKLSEVNDSGIYLPPSPMEKKSFWHRSEAPPNAKYREAIKDCENDGGFAISRESFDSYRRSFDISARSPVPGSMNSSRQSLDQRPSRASLDLAYSPRRTSLDSRMNSLDSTAQRIPSDSLDESPSEEEEFRDIDLNDSKTHIKKKGFLSRFGGNSDHIPEAGEHKGRSRSSTITWRKETNKESEELGDIASTK